jgi:hypothetical protein
MLFKHIYISFTFSKIAFARFTLFTGFKVGVVLGICYLYKDGVFTDTFYSVPRKNYSAILKRKQTSA